MLFRTLGTFAAAPNDPSLFIPTASVSNGKLLSKASRRFEIRSFVLAIKKSLLRLAAQLSAQALFTARLLAGEMPQEIEQAFTEAGLSLFPEKSNEISTACSCPNWSNPCKHVAAVY
jgi:uncharacterized Zn finger protein